MLKYGKALSQLFILNLLKGRVVIPLLLSIDVIREVLKAEQSGDGQEVIESRARVMDSCGGHVRALTIRHLEEHARAHVRHPRGGLVRVIGRREGQ